MRVEGKELRKLKAHVAILEAETSLLSDTVDEALHWDQPHEIKSHLMRITKLAQIIANTCNLGDLKE